MTNLRPTFLVDHVVLDGHCVFLLLLLTNRGRLCHGSLTLFDLPVEAHHVLVAACWLLMEKQDCINEDKMQTIKSVGKVEKIFFLFLSFC